MVYYRESFKTEEEAIKWRERLYENYHPCGYGTSVTIHAPKTVKNSTDEWLAIGSRGNSCD